MDVPAHTEIARRQLTVGLAAVIVALAALFAATPAMAEEVVVEEVSGAATAETASETTPAAPAEEIPPAEVPAAETPAPTEATGPAEAEATPVEDLLTLLPAEEAAVEADPAPAVTETAVAPAAPSPAASPSPAAPLTVPALPPNAALDAPDSVVAPSRPDPATPGVRPYASPVLQSATLSAPEPPPDAVPAALSSPRLKLNDSGLGPALDQLTKDWTVSTPAASAADAAATDLPAAELFVEQITAVDSYALPSAGGGFLQLLVAWVAPGDLGGSAVLAPLTQLLFVLVAWMLIRPRPFREAISRFSADPRMGYRAVVLRPG